MAIEAAPALVNLFPAGAASVITASDFFRSFRSSVSVDDFSASRLFIGDKEIKPADISGVITAVPCFFPAEFYYVNPEDREYVCGETNAFFQYFLNELKCLKCNPPDERLFVAGAGHKLEWVRKAISLNIPLLPFHFKNVPADQTKNGPEPALDKCSVIFDEITNCDLPEKVQQHAKALANTLSLSYLDCYFVQGDNKKYLLSHINTIPDISIPKNREQIADHFMRALM
ncbi:MAG TPA: hypothetical protein VFK88_10455 [Gallionella sp.]|nr:hypothetical protein [Gallionella sp.]